MFKRHTRFWTSFSVRYVRTSLSCGCIQLHRDTEIIKKNFSHACLHNSTRLPPAPRSPSAVSGVYNFQYTQPSAIFRSPLHLVHYITYSSSSSIYAVRGYIMDAHKKQTSKMHRFPINGLVVIVNSSYRPILLLFLYIYTKFTTYCFTTILSV